MPSACPGKLPTAVGKLQTSKYCTTEKGTNGVVGPRGAPPSTALVASLVLACRIAETGRGYPHPVAGCCDRDGRTSVIKWPEWWRWKEAASIGKRHRVGDEATNDDGGNMNDAGPKQRSLFGTRPTSSFGLERFWLCRGVFDCNDGRHRLDSAAPRNPPLTLASLTISSRRSRSSWRGALVEQLETSSGSCPLPIRLQETKHRQSWARSFRWSRSITLGLFPEVLPC